MDLGTKLKNSRIKGYLAGAVAEVTYGMNPLFTLPLYAVGMTANSVLFFRYLCAIPIIWAMARFRGQPLRVDLRQLATLVVLGAMFAISSLSLYESYNYMGAGIASTLLFVYPVIVALIMRVVFGERLGLITGVCILMAMVGIGLLYKGEGGETLSAVGTTFVAISAISYAIYIVMTNRSNISGLPTLTVTFYVLLFGWMVFAIRALWIGELQVPERQLLWLNIAGLALLPTAISLLFTTVAIKLIGSTPTAIMGALEPATALFFGITVFDETLTGRDVVGLVLIISAVSLIVAGSSIATAINRVRKLFPRRR